jgi:isopentenyl diphosphate isomerase/L-lactate dehydrogenase-like FMN-dependent dehydrogenase
MAAEANASLLRQHAAVILARQAAIREVKRRRQKQEIKGTLPRYFTEMLHPSMNWSDVADMVRLWNGQFCLKGIMSVADARHAVEIGCTARGVRVTRYRASRREEQIPEQTPWSAAFTHIILLPCR